MTKISWIKLDVEMFNNKKIRHIRNMPEGNNIVLIWVMLLTMAGNCNAGGFIFLTENIPYTTKALADELGFGETTIQLALNVLEKFGMIEFYDDQIAVVDWENHQNMDALEAAREKSKERSRKYRERKKQKLEDKEQKEENVTSRVTLRITSRHGAEEEKDKEIDTKEKYSFGVPKEKCDGHVTEEQNTSAPLRSKKEIAIPLRNEETYLVQESDLDEYRELYPGIDVELECRRAAVWSRDKPEGRKTRKTVKRFLNGWMARAAGKAEDVAKPKPNSFHNFDQRNTNYDALLMDKSQSGG